MCIRDRDSEAGLPQAAIRAYERAARHDPDFLPVILPALLECYALVGERTGARAFLAEMCEHYRGIAPVLALARMIDVYKRQGNAWWCSYIGWTKPWILC